MTFRRLLRRNLWFHRRGNFAVLLGVAVGTAVITGALLVGDSLRGSLRERAMRRIGWVNYALVAPRFFREPSDLSLERVITVRATLERFDESSFVTRRVPNVDVWAGLSDLGYLRTQPHEFAGFFEMLFWRLGLRRVAERSPLDGMFPRSLAEDLPPGESWITEDVAKLLDLRVGDSIRLIVAKNADIPRESLLGKRDRDATSQTVTARVGGVVPRSSPAAEFSLSPVVEQQPNVFVNLDWLQQQLGLASRINALLTHKRDLSVIQRELDRFLNLADWGLVIRTPQSRTDALFVSLDRNKDDSIQQNEWRGRMATSVVEAADKDRNRTLTRDEIESHFQQRGYVSLESKQMLIEPAAERAALEAAKQLGLRAEPTLIYLANSISDGNDTVPYSIIAAMDTSSLARAAGSEIKELKDDEILLAEWKDSPLNAKPGDKITVTYFEPELEGRIKETTATFTFRGLVPMTGLAADPDLAPEFPGITDKLDLKDWDPPFPYDNKRIQPRDDEYWNRYRTTPKAYITLAAGQKLFGSRFGQITSIRLSTSDGQTPDEHGVQQFEKAMLAKLDPAAGGFVFEDVRARALAASTGGQDFGMLFLGFSFFLIAAALMLVGLLVRLNIERRAGEVGLLLASGFNLRTVRRLIVREGMMLGIAGAIIGLFLAAGYAALMLRLLAALWPDGSVGSFLSLHVGGASLLYGFVGTLIAVWLTLRWAVRTLNKVAPSALLAGVATVENAKSDEPGRKAIIIAIVSLVIAAALLIGGHFAHHAEARAGTFFGGGAALLTAILAGGWAWLRRPERTPIRPGPAALARLGGRNTQRNPTRSLLTAAVLASAAFLLVAVESFRRSPEGDFYTRTGGSGGFPLIAETDLPLYQDPTGPEGRQEWLDTLEKNWLKQGLPPEQVREKLAAAKSTIDAATIIPLRKQAGDDASCLNLYQPGKPRILGVPRSLIDRGGFHFAGSEGGGDNPWSLLDLKRDDGEIPAIGEANTVAWMLKSGLGKTIAVRDEQGREVKLRIVGLLKDSAFQGELLVSDASFRALFPRQEGYSVLLIDPAKQADELRSLVNTGFADRGLNLVNARDKLQGYLQVENTYLSTFQVLGGFGLLLGTLGLAVVLLRNVWERRREFALLRAVGYRRRDLGWLVLAENALLVLFGLLAGVGAAVIAVAPQLMSGNVGTPWLRLTALLGLALVAGIVSGLAAMRSATKAPLILALRTE